MTISDFKQQLREHGFRATPARMRVLTFLQKQQRPISIERIRTAVPKTNPTTLYRMMTDFVRAGLVDAQDLGHGHADYELADRPHHHHAVCEHCGFIEDVHPCDEQADLEQAVLKASRSFSQINLTPTSFFGVCKSCQVSDQSSSSLKD